MWCWWLVGVDGCFVLEFGCWWWLVGDGGWLLLVVGWCSMVLVVGGG